MAIWLEIMCDLRHDGGPDWQRDNPTQFFCSTNAAEAPSTLLLTNQVTNGMVKLAREATATGWRRMRMATKIANHSFLGWACPNCHKRAQIDLPFKKLVPL